jgi:single-stranded DNA-binding protein
MGRFETEVLTGKDGQQVRRPTEWHSVISFSQSKIELLENSVMVGDLVKVTGSLHSRSVMVDGVSRTVSEIHLGEISLVARKVSQVVPVEVAAPAKKRKAKVEGQGVAA